MENEKRERRSNVQKARAQKQLACERLIRASDSLRQARIVLSDALERQVAYNQVANGDPRELGVKETK